MKKLPKYVWVLGRKHPVYLKNTGQNNRGLYDRGAIYVSQDQPERDRWQTLIHEMGHALFERSGISQGIDYNLEQVIVDAYATMIVEAFDLVPKKEAGCPKTGVSSGSSSVPSATRSRT